MTFKLTPPKPFVPTEYSDQVAIFEYAKLMERKDRRWKLLFSTLNGVRLPIGLAKKMKAAGNKQGVPDLIWPVPRAHYHGLFLELKREKGGVVSDAQEEWHETLLFHNYYVAVAYGAKDAIRILEAYIAL